MSRRYPVPAGRHRVEETRDRSRFIATVGPARTVEEARAFVAEVAEEFPDATHNCWAHVVGPPGDTSRAGMSDAGEPHGTAGRPMLDVLLGSGVGDVVAVVTRYYGGRKLGKGGLVRAYGDGVKLALEGMPTREFVESVELRVTIPYRAVPQFKSMAAEYEARVLDESYTTDATFRVSLPKEEAPQFADAVFGMTNGSAAVEPWAA
ncbi:MAG: YigZ family protein [Candidatus Eisenbacteria bacterium]|nr:YigZ family protein [Candidatus Eisenbacteria bacterium]